MKLLFVTCFYNRPQISKLYLLGLKRLQKVHPFEVLVCCSDDKSIELCRKEGINYFYHENKPLGAKHNKLFEKVISLNPDYIVHSGDDNLMSNELFEVMLNQMSLGREYIKPQGLYFLDSKTKEVIEFDPTNTFGAFRAFKTEMLINAGTKHVVHFRATINDYKENEAYKINHYLYNHLMPKGWVAHVSTKFELYNPEINSFLDGSSEANIMQIGTKETIIELGTQIIDVKSEQNIWGFEHYAKRSKKATFEKMCKLIGEEEINYINQL